LKSKIVSLALFTLIAVLTLSAETLLAQQAGAPIQMTSRPVDATILNTLNTVRNLARVGDYDRALMMLQSLKKTYGENPEINSEIKNIYRAKKDYPQLKKMIQDELTTNPDSFDLICQLGEAYFLTDSLNLAKLTWEKALNLAGIFDYKYMILGSYYRSYGFYDEAAAVYRKGRTTLKRPELFTNELIDIFISQRNYREVIAEYLNKLRFEPTAAADISTQLAQLDTSGIKPEEIRQEFTRAIKNNPNEPNLYGLLGDIDARGGNLKEAYENYKQADRLSGSNGIFIYGFTRSCYASGKYDMVVRAADEYIPKFKEPNMIAQLKLLKAKSLAGLALYPQAFTILNELSNSTDIRWKTDAVFTAGELYESKLNLPDSAIAKFTQVAQTRVVPAQAGQAKMHLGEISIKRGDYPKAESWLEQLTSEQAPAIAEKAMFLMAEISFYKYDFDTAIEKYKTLTGTFFNGVYVNDCMDRMAFLQGAAGDSTAYFMADAMRYRYIGLPDSAVAAVEKAARFTSSEQAEYVLFKLAGFYEESGNWLKEVDTYEQYISRYPDGLYQDQALYALGVVYYEKLKQPAKADASFNKLLSDFPLSPLIEKARAYLNKIKTS
jgi:tetratricopeptide (TPR) repeat protein